MPRLAGLTHSQKLEKRRLQYAAKKKKLSAMKRKMTEWNAELYPPPKSQGFKFPKRFVYDKPNKKKVSSASYLAKHPQYAAWRAKVLGEFHHPDFWKMPVRQGGAGPGEDCTSTFSLCTTSGYTCLPGRKMPDGSIQTVQRPDGSMLKTCQARAIGAPCGAWHAARCPGALKCSSYWSGTCQ